MNNLIPEFSESLFTLSATTEDILEVGLDQAMKDGILKDIPIVSTVVNLCRFGISLRERNFLNQTLIFINSFNDGSISEEKLADYRSIIENNDKRTNQELERVLFLLESHLDEIKSKILGAFFRCYIMGTISWDKFCELSETNKQLFVSDYKLLFSIYRKEEISIKNTYRLHRLISLGLIEKNEKVNPISVSESIKDRNDDVFVVSTFGITFCELTKKLM